jgi:hypothetical protein
MEGEGIPEEHWRVGKEEEGGREREGGRGKVRDWVGGRWREEGGRGREGGGRRLPSKFSRGVKERESARKRERERARARERERGSEP